MTEEEMQQAAAYLKLHENVKQLIVDAVFEELQKYGSPLHTHIKTCTLYSPEFERQVKTTIAQQMHK